MSKESLLNKLDRKKKQTNTLKVISSLACHTWSMTLLLDIVLGPCLGLWLELNPPLSGCVVIGHLIHLTQRTDIPTLHGIQPPRLSILFRDI